MPLGIENTLLYLGAWDDFEAQLLAEVEAQGWNAPAQRFYWGYVTLLRGDRVLAARRYQPAPGQGWSPYRFGRLARLFSLVQLGDYVSCYLALLYGMDPTPVDAIEAFKAGLSDPAG